MRRPAWLVLPLALLAAAPARALTAAPVQRFRQPLAGFALQPDGSLALALLARPQRASRFDLVTLGPDGRASPRRALFTVPPGHNRLALGGDGTADAVTWQRDGLVLQRRDPDGLLLRRVRSDVRSGEVELSAAADGGVAAAWLESAGGSTRVRLSLGLHAGPFASPLTLGRGARALVGVTASTAGGALVEYVNADGRETLAVARGATVGPPLVVPGAGSSAAIGAGLDGSFLVALVRGSPSGASVSTTTIPGTTTAIPPPAGVPGAGFSREVLVGGALAPGGVPALATADLGELTFRPGPAFAPTMPLDAVAALEPPPSVVAADDGTLAAAVAGTKTGAPVVRLFVRAPDGTVDETDSPRVLGSEDSVREVHVLANPDGGYDVIGVLGRAQGTEVQVARFTP